MRVLVSAYSCEPGRGSEGEIGWRMVLQLAQTYEVWVITRENLRPVHDAAFTKTAKPENLHFVYFDLPWIFRFYKRGKRFFLVYYYLWQLGVGLKARQLIRDKPFDLLHHLIGGMDWMPAGLALAPGPFLWGPVGSESTHPVIRARLSPRELLKDRIRVAIRGSMRTLDPFVRITSIRARRILSHTPETMPRRYSPKMCAFVQTGIENSLTLARLKTDFSRQTSLRLIFAGELKDWKGGRLALDAALLFFETEPNAELVIIGDGPQCKSMKALAQDHSQGGRVSFLGRVSMADLVEELHKSDIFLYPSYHHGLATVVLQAMLTGLPTVCLEGDAISRAVGHTAGTTVALGPQGDPVRDLSQAIKRLAEDEETRSRLARNAQSIALKRYSYEELARTMIGIYSEVVGHTPKIRTHDDAR